MLCGYGLYAGLKPLHVCMLYLEFFMVLCRVECGMLVPCCFDSGDIVWPSRC